MMNGGRLSSIELFSGAGGLALGLERAGFHHDLLVEWDADSCSTLRGNKPRWDVRQADVRMFDFSPFVRDVDLLAGGPPCQPFSLGGKHRAFLDERDMFPQAVRAVRELRPRAFVFENVKGLTRPAFSKYFEYILLQMTYPTLVRKDENEEWLDHLSRLENHHTKGRVRDLSYRVVFRVLNAANYGVPQRRERVFFVGFRDDTNIEWSFPDPTHSYESLIESQVSGEYWERHRIHKKHRVTPLVREANEQLTFESLFRLKSLKPWKTTRDAIGDLPPPRESGNSEFSNHRLVKGARAYAGHTGSHLDLPAKTLKAGDHGVPGGENMIALPGGRVRYFTVREAARIQTFPDSYSINGSWTESMRQLGNAVPVDLANIVGRDIKRKLLAI